MSEKSRMFGKIEAFIGPDTGPVFECTANSNGTLVQCESSERLPIGVKIQLRRKDGRYVVVWHER